MNRLLQTLTYKTTQIKRTIILRGQKKKKKKSTKKRNSNPKALATHSSSLLSYPDSKISQNQQKVTKTRKKSKKMVYTYTPTYYTSLHDSITSLCKTILPFSLKKKRLAAAEHRLAKLQSDNLKWQQDSFHQILNLMGLHKEGILDEPQLSAFRSNLLDTLIASPAEHEQPVILRDKLVFLQVLIHLIQFSIP